MKEHQTNEIGRLMTERIIEEHSNDYIPWHPTCNTDIGVGLQVHLRILEDAFKVGEYDYGTGIWNKAQIVAAIETTRLTLNVLTSHGNGWYCMYCGWLHPEEVTNDERCDKCGAILPHNSTHVQVAKGDERCQRLN